MGEARDGVIEDVRCEQVPAGTARGKRCSRKLFAECSSALHGLIWHGVMERSRAMAQARQARRSGQGGRHRGHTACAEHVLERFV